MSSYLQIKPPVILLLLLSWQNSLNAAEFDPTRPPLTSPRPAAPAVVKAVKVNPQDYKVTSILIAQQRKIAVVNHQVVTPGDTVNATGSGKVTVKDITSASVRLVKASQEFEVRLPSAQLSKTFVSENKFGKAPARNARESKPPVVENNEGIKETH